MRLHQIRDAKACVRDTGDRLIQVWRQQNNNTYYPGAVYSYDGEGKRIRSDQYAFGTNTIQGWREYSYFNGQMLAEHDNTGAWTDYVYANGKKIARASAQETVLQMSGTYSGGWSATGYTVGAPSMQGYVFRTGDVLLVRQRKYGSNVHGGILIFGDGTGSYFYDQDGQRADDDLLGDGVWHNRRIPLDGLQGKTYTSLSMGGGFSTDYTFQFASVAVMSADGSVRTIFNGEAEALTSSGGPPNGAGTMAAVPADANSTHYYVGDQVGTTQMELSAAGAPLWKGEFGPFGQELDIQATTNRYKFTGKERDSESGLDYFGARYYGSSMGRFMSPDPLNMSAVFHPDDPQAWNGYSYSRNNPLKFTDPSGMNYQVCDANGQNCSNIDDKTFEANQAADRKNGVQYSNGTISQHDADGNSVKSGTYKQTDVDLPGDAVSNQAGLNTLATASRGVTTVTAVVGGVYGVAGAAIVGGPAVAGIARWGLQRLVLGASAPALVNLLNRLYQAQDEIPGGTAGAVRNEVMTGEFIHGGHSIKASEMVTALQNLVNSGTLSGSDQMIAGHVISDLKNSLGR